ncbi:MAG: type 2 isopentenyl-diphosphate Delta-isomerase [Tatlockia sp.]|nr:type 2 isopentenyl-diphosphate Delta-isomerase [Tatlockia sp.]
MSDNYNQFEKRKQDHIDLALMQDNQASEFNVFDNWSLVHEALPDLDFDDIQISSQRFQREVPSPFFVSSMTAGHRGAISINHNLIEACAESGWAMGVGSQRRELTDHGAAQEWRALRRSFPKVSLFSNLGIAQIIELPISQIQNLIEALEAEALIIHCNPLQEAIQPEGTPQFKGGLAALAKLVSVFDLPIIVKETGCGFSVSTLQRLNDIGVQAVDVSGLGGTHWGRIEGHRAAEGSIKQKTAITFRNWGIDTVQSVLNALSIDPKFEIWGSGGVRNGLDAAKLIALGANSVGFAKPMLNAALQDSKQVFELMQAIEYELKVAMFCTGSAALSELKDKLCH